MFDLAQNKPLILIAQRCVGLINLVVLLTATTAMAEVDISPIVIPANLQTSLDYDYDGDRVSSTRGGISLDGRGCKIRHCCDSARGLRQRRLCLDHATASFNGGNLLTKLPIAYLSTLTMSPLTPQRHQSTKPLVSTLFTIVGIALVACRSLVRPVYDVPPNKHAWRPRTVTAFSVLYFRARYYDTNVGEFISRDPLEYVDGMSLYRGYFVPGRVDPSGLKRITIQIAAFINEADGESVTAPYNVILPQSLNSSQLIENSTWFRSPSPLDRFRFFTDSVVHFRTDSRKKYQQGTSRAKHTISFDTDDVGSLQGKVDFGFQNDPTFAYHRRLTDFSTIILRNAKANFSRNPSVEDTSGFTSQIRDAVSGSDPLTFGAPALDYEFAINVRCLDGMGANANGQSGTEVSVVFKHDKFPDYEVLLDGAGKYHFRGENDFLAGGIGLISSNGNRTIELGVF